jgi:hypothetical protein
MSRSGYTDDFGDDDPLAFGRYRRAVQLATTGRRGQQFFKDLLVAMDTMPEKRLIANELEAHGGVCAIGALGRARGMDMSNLDPDCPERVAPAFNIAESLAREIVWENDECGPWNETSEQRFERMRKWVVAQIVSKPEAIS